MGDSPEDRLEDRYDDKVLSIDIAVPVTTVWSEITKTGKLQRALYNTVLESDLRPGAKLRYYSPNRKRVFIVGEVLEVEAPRRFSHTYSMTMDDELPTIVTWELEEIADGCRVTIVHSGWTEAHKKPEKVAAGWREILSLLKTLLETGDLPWKTKLMYAVMTPFMVFMPKSTKTEEVERAGW